jgi:organic hydroperoxide reductase OsmC/OhrA
VIRKAKAVWFDTGRGGTKEGFRISGSAPTLRASAANRDQDTFDRLARNAEKNCPVSKVLSAEITLDAKPVLDEQP